MRISLVISTYNQPEALAKVLAGVQLQHRKPDELLIADDGSGEPTRALLRQWQVTSGTSVRHCWHPDQGFRKTIILNQALAQVTGDYLVFLDGDCVPHASFVADHERLAEKGFWVQGRRCFVEEKYVSDFVPGVTSIMSWVLSGRISGAAKAVHLPWPILRRDQMQRGIIGCNMGFWKDDLFAVNGFDEAYTGWGIGEDSDLGTRLYHLGRPRKFVYGRAIIYHLNHPMLPRDHVAASKARLQETLRTRRVRCERGIDQYL